jgi:hypothetical protein
VGTDATLWPTRAYTCNSAATLGALQLLVQLGSPCEMRGRSSRRRLETLAACSPRFRCRRGWRSI